MLDDLLHMIFPRVCAACERALFKYEHSICLHCRHHLPRTGFHLKYDNPVIRMFWGRVAVQAAASYFYYKKGSHVQKIIHRLKYKGEQEIGREIGSIYGKELKTAPIFSGITRIIPVPLHPARMRSRGYNQSESFALGLSEIMSAPVDTDLLVRNSKTGTQTKKSRYSRWSNVGGNFQLKSFSLPQKEHFLLVDDVITTGATLEACATELLKIEGAGVSIVTIASTFN